MPHRGPGSSTVPGEVTRHLCTAFHFLTAQLFPRFSVGAGLLRQPPQGIWGGSRYGHAASTPRPAALKCLLSQLLARVCFAVLADCSPGVFSMDTSTEAAPNNK